MPKRKPDARPSFWGMARSFLHVHCERARAMSPKTVEAYRIALECYVSYLVSVEGVTRPDVSFDHLERSHVRGWATWMSETAGYSPRTVALRLAAIRSFLAYCGSEDVSLAALYERAKTVRGPRVPREPIDHLEAAELAALLSAETGLTAKSRRNRMALVMLYETAARVSELVGMRLGDVCLSRPAHVTVTGKGNKARVVPIGDKCAAHLRVYLDEFHAGEGAADPSRPLFYSTRDGRPHALSTDTVSLVLKRAGDVARESCPSVPGRMHCHLLRKSRAMELYKSGVPLPIVMQMLGHESMSTTSAFYAFATVDMMSRAVEESSSDILSRDTGWLSDERREALYSLR